MNKHFNELTPAERLALFIEDKELEEIKQWRDSIDPHSMEQVYRSDWVKKMDTLITALEAEKEKMRAFLESAEFQKVDDLLECADVADMKLLGNLVAKETKNLISEKKKLQKIIDEAHSWAVCAVISSDEEMMQNIDRIVEITTPKYER